MRLILLVTLMLARLHAFGYEAVVPEGASKEQRFAVKLDALSNWLDSFNAQCAGGSGGNAAASNDCVATAKLLLDYRDQLSAEANTLQAGPLKERADDFKAKCDSNSHLGSLQKIGEVAGSVDMISSQITCNDGQKTNLVSLECGMEVTCTAIRSITTLSRFVFLKGTYNVAVDKIFGPGKARDCVSVKERPSCLGTLARGFFEGAWGSLTSAWGAVKWVSGKAVDGVKSLWRESKKVEDQTSEQLLGASRLSNSEVSQGSHGALSYFTTAFGGFVNMIGDFAKEKFGCSRWDGDRCVEMMSSWECGSCAQKINLICGMMSAVPGFLIGEVATAYLTGGATAALKILAKGFAKGAGAFARIGELSKLPGIQRVLDANAKFSPVARAGADAAIKGVQLGATGLKQAFSYLKDSTPMLLAAQLASKAMTNPTANAIVSKAGAVAAGTSDMTMNYVKLLGQANALGFRNTHQAFDAGSALIENSKAAMALRAEERANPKASAKDAPEAPLKQSFWLRKNPYMNNPLNQDQAAFLQKIGVEIKGNRVTIPNPRETALRINEMIDNLIKTGKVRPEDALHMADIYVGEDGKLIFTRAGTPAPPNSKPFVPSQFRVSGTDSNGGRMYVDAGSVRKVEFKDGRLAVNAMANSLLSNADYFRAISQGLFPGAADWTKPPYFSVLSDKLRIAPPELAALHDYAHIGGFVEHPEGMGPFKKAALAGDSISPTIQGRMFMVNEDWMVLKPNSKESLQGVLKANNLEFKDVRNVAEVSQRLNSISPAELERLSKQLIIWHQENRLPFGGSMRTGSYSHLVYQPIEELAKVLALPADRITRLNQVTQYITSARELADTNMKGWFKFAGDGGLPAKNSPYYRYLCESPQVSKAVKQMWCTESLFFF